MHTSRFVNLAGGSAKICEYNQEACRINAFDGRKSLVRSFPSKVAVRTHARPHARTHTHTRTRSAQRTRSAVRLCA